MPEETAGTTGNTGEGNAGSGGQGGAAGAAAGESAGAAGGAGDSGFGPFKDGQAAYAAYKELQSGTSKKDLELKELRDRIEELSAVEDLSLPKVEDFDIAKFQEDFAKDPKKALESIVDPKLKTLEGELRITKFQAKVEKARGQYKDFNKYEGEMEKLVKQGVVNPNHPQAVDFLYALVKAREAGTTNANKQTSGSGNKTPFVGEGGSAGGGAPAKTDYSKLTLEQLEALATSQPGAKTR